MKKTTANSKMKKVVKKAIKVEKKLVRAVKSEARSVKFQVKKLSGEVKEDAGKVAGELAEKVEQVGEKVKKHLNVGVLLAEAVAGITLIATLGAYSVYVVRHGGKKVDFNKMKLEVLREVRKATEEAKKIGEMEIKKISDEAKKVAGKR